MATLREITYSILDVIRPKNLSGEPITEELVDFYVTTTRAMLIRQSLNKGYFVDPTLVQSLGCIELVEADTSECCSFPTGCTILRTDQKIPQPIDGMTSLITRVGPVDITARPYQQVEYERVPFLGDNKYTKSLVKWFTHTGNNYIYLIINTQDLLAKSIEVINVQGVFEQPEDAGEFQDCSTGVCYSRDKSPYPVNEAMIPIIQDIVIKKLLLMANQPIDKSNDNSVNPETTIIKGT